MMREGGQIRFNKWLVLVGFVGALFVALPSILVGPDFGTFILSVLLLLGTSLALSFVFLIRVRHDTAASFSMILVFLISSWLLWRITYPVRNTGRWLIESQQYKAEVLSQPEGHNGELRHLEWEAWGGPGAGDTTIYLVFDPKDDLFSAAKSGQQGKYSGIPCIVPQIHQFERHWYTVKFYTDTDWDHCGQDI